ncbi:MAG: RNA polymerase sigma factor [Cyclobacteriaceae bacterium]
MRIQKDNESEIELLEEYKQTGNLEVLGQLYAPFMPMVYGVCLKYMASPADAQDAVMGIFEKLVVDLKKHEIQNFKSWLHVTSKNYCLMALRSAKSKTEKQTVDFDEERNMELSEIPHHNEEVKLEEDLNKLEECIETLNTEQKSSVHLFFLQQKCYSEIVGITGYDLKKVKSYIQNGKRNLKICMEGNRD